METSTIAPPSKDGSDKLSLLSMKLGAAIVHLRAKLGLSISAGWLTSWVLASFENHWGRRLSCEEGRTIRDAITNLHRPEVAAAHHLEVHQFAQSDGWIPLDDIKIATGIEGGPTVLVSAINPPLALVGPFPLRYPLTAPASEVVPVEQTFHQRLFELLSGHLVRQAHKSEVKAVLEEQVDQVLTAAGFQILPGRNRARPAHLRELTAEVKAQLGGWSDSLARGQGGLVNLELRNRSRETITRLRPADKKRNRPSDEEIFKALWEEHGIPTVLVTAKASQEIRDQMRNEFGGAVIETSVFVAPDTQTKFTLDDIGMPWPTTWTLPPQAQTEIVEVATRLAHESWQRLSPAAREVVRAMELAAATEPVNRSTADRELRAARVRDLAAKGWSQDEIARELPASKRTVRELVKGEGIFARGRPKRPVGEAEKKVAEDAGLCPTDSDIDG